MPAGLHTGRYYLAVDKDSPAFVEFPADPDDTCWKERKSVGIIGVVQHDLMLEERLGELRGGEKRHIDIQTGCMATRPRMAVRTLALGRS